MGFSGVIDYLRHNQCCINHNGGAAEHRKAANVEQLRWKMPSGSNHLLLGVNKIVFRFVRKVGGETWTDIGGAERKDKRYSKEGGGGGVLGVEGVSGKGKGDSRCKDTVQRHSVRCLVCWSALEQQQLLVCSYGLLVERLNIRACLEQSSERLVAGFASPIIRGALRLSDRSMKWSDLKRCEVKAGLHPIPRCMRQKSSLAVGSCPRIANKWLVNGVCSNCFVYNITSVSKNNLACIV